MQSARSAFFMREAVHVVGHGASREGTSSDVTAPYAQHPKRLRCERTERGLSDDRCFHTSRFRRSITGTTIARSRRDARPSPWIDRHRRAFPRSVRGGGPAGPGADRPGRRADPSNARRLPYLADWSWRPHPVKGVEVLWGDVAGHARLGSGMIYTGRVWAMAIDRSWALTTSRFYRLGPSADR